MLYSNQNKERNKPWMSHHALLNTILITTHYITHDQTMAKRTNLYFMEVSLNQGSISTTKPDIIIMYSFICCFTKLEHIAHYKAKDKQSKQISARTHTHTHTHTHTGVCAHTHASTQAQARAHTHTHRVSRIA